MFTIKGDTYVAKYHFFEAGLAYANLFARNTQGLTKF
jgi:hypothetical protein